MAARIAYEPGSSEASASTLSNTSSTEALSTLPTCAQVSRPSWNAIGERWNSSCNASITLGPPGCIIHVEEEHAEVGQAELTGSWNHVTADQGGGGDDQATFG